MINVLFRLLFITGFFMVLVQAETPPARRPPPRGNLREPPTCETLKCATDRVCIPIGFTAKCVIPKGQPCSFDDLCEDGHPCNGRKTCSGLGLPLNAPCQISGCETGIYCDAKQERCL